MCVCYSCECCAISILISSQISDVDDIIILQPVDVLICADPHPDEATIPTLFLLQQLTKCCRPITNYKNM